MVAHMIVHIIVPVIVHMIVHTIVHVIARVRMRCCTCEGLSWWAAGGAWNAANVTQLH